MSYQAAIEIVSREFPDVPRPLMDEALVLVARGAVTITPGDPLEIQVLDPAYLETEPIILGPALAAGTWMCPCMEEVGITEPCVHLVAALVMLAQYEAQQDEREPISLVPAPGKTDVIRHEPHSLSIKGITAKGFEVFLCLRGFDERQLFTRAARLLEAWEQKGWQPPYGSRRPITYQEAQEKAAAPSGTTATPSVAEENKPKEGTPGAQDILVFHAERMEANFLNRTWYWAVFGYDMPRSRAKFGVRIWEEGLKTGGFDLKTLDPQNPPSLDGFLAHYILNADGTPDKIVRLIRQ